MKFNTQWTRNHLIGIEDLTSSEINIILETASSFKKTMLRSNKKLPTLRGRTIVNFFMEPSTRTRMAFEVAAGNLSADVITIYRWCLEPRQGETLRDTANNIKALNADMIIMRHSSAGAPKYLSRVVDLPIVNAGDGAHEHPTQALLDCYTLRENLGDLAGRKVTILGDILFSRVARSNI